MQNLLILGEGGHGRVVMETAEAMGMFGDIAFLDDNNPEAIGQLADYARFRCVYDAAFVAIGDNRTRSIWNEKLVAAGYTLPVLIHPRAYVSPSITVGAGTIIEPLACVNAGVVIGVGCIISISTVIDHDSTIGDYAHIDCGTVLAPRSVVEPFSKINRS